MLISKFSCNSSKLVERLSSNLDIFSEKETKVFAYSSNLLSLDISLFLKSFLKVSDRILDSSTRSSILATWSDRTLLTATSFPLISSLIEVRLISNIDTFWSSVRISSARSLDTLCISSSTLILDSRIFFLFLFISFSTSLILSL